MARSSALALSLVVATAACGAVAAPPPATGTARPALPPAPADEPLIRTNLETDADIARAIREYYTKYEYRIPMRDGAKLFTVAYVPKDPAHTYPILMQRTPYSVEPYGVDSYPGEKASRALRVFAPSKEIVKEGYIIVLQDVRGRMMSEGTFVDIRPLLTPGARKNTKDIDEATDTYDTVDFLVKNVPGNSGKVGMWGISYPGFYAAQGAVDAHPALKAVSPQAPVTEWFVGDDFHHNGVLFVADAFRFLSNFGRARPEPVKKSTWTSPNEGIDNYEFFLEAGPLSSLNKKYLKDGIGFWNDLMAHPNRDAWWKARDPRPSYRNATPAVMTVGGWFDAEDLFGALETYRAFEKQSPRNENVLVMGPWRHGGWARSDGDHLGDITFGQKTSQYYREKIELPFFQRHLKGKKGPAAPEAYVFETGTNTWHQYSAWPPPTAQKAMLFLRENGKLGAAVATSDEASDAWLSDPKKPVPYRGQTVEATDAEYMIDDQRFAARRPDVMVYATGELDADVVLAGPIEASLWVSTTGTDADFVVKVVDVWPSDVPDPEPNPKSLHMGGYQELVRAEIMRAKYRSSLETPEPMKPGEPTLVKITLPDVSHAFRTGHKLMVQIQSTWFPLADRNPQTFLDITKATEADFKAQTHRIYRGRGGKASFLTVTLARGALPR